ncbi:MAG: SDR family oxidoreductase [Burkholderiaceae bacterium]
MRLEGKTALVTGAGSGFGEGIAQRFAQEGARLIINDINAENGERVAESIRATGAECHFIQANVADGADFAASIKASIDRYNGLDIVVNNAGVSHLNRPMLEVDEAEFDRVFAINVKSIYWCAQHAVPVMQKKGGGAIINIASTAGVRPRPGLTWYNASKGALITLTKSMAVELAPTGIRVNAVNPVAGETPLLATFMGEDTPEKRAQFVSTVPLGRLSQPSDIATATLFYAADEAAFITGTCLEVDGGRCI